MSARAIEHAALQWFVVYQQRLDITSEKRRVAKAIKASGSGWHRTLSDQETDLAARLTPMRKKELMALRKLAKACAEQRGRLDGADVIDVDVRLVAHQGDAP